MKIMKVWAQEIVYMCSDECEKWLRENIVVKAIKPEDKVRMRLIRKRTRGYLCGCCGKEYRL